MFKIKTLNKIDEKGLNLFNENFKIVDEDNVHGILVRSCKMHEMNLEDSIQAIGRAGAGVNNIPVDTCSEKGIVVFNTPGANANGVKELVMAALFLASRDIVGAVEWAKTLDGKGDEIPKLVEAGKSNFAGPEVCGKTLGVIGLGAIGVLVANTAKSLGMDVLGYDPFISVESAWGLSRSVKKADNIDELFEKADYITIHVPLMEATKAMVNKDKINIMKDGVRILNFSRAGLCDDNDLLEGLQCGKIARYITDFPYEKVLNMPNTVCIPHLGASTPESEVNCAVMAVRQLKDYMENGNITNSVNYPECDMGICSSVGRIAVNHKNIPHMVSNITATLANKNLNIADMINKSKKDWAYTLIDVESEITEEIVNKLKSIEGVVKVRVIK